MSWAMVEAGGRNAILTVQRCDLYREDRGDSDRLGVEIGDLTKRTLLNLSFFQQKKTEEDIDIPGQLCSMGT